MPPALGQRVAGSYLAGFDRVLPGRLEGFYLVGSIALGEFRPHRSDIDFFAVMTGAVEPAAFRLLRSMNRRGSALAVWWTLRAGIGRWPPTGFNGVFVTWKDLASSPCRITPIASQRAGRFVVGSAFDANPVTWKVLAEHGVAVRGPDPKGLGVYSDERELRDWVAGNLSTYWATWSDLVRGRSWVAAKGLLRNGAAWGVLGAPRLHATLATGEILSKEQAGEYAMDVFPDWRPLILDALAYWRGEPGSAQYTSPTRRRQAAADFVAAVVADARTRFQGFAPCNRK